MANAILFHQEHMQERFSLYHFITSREDYVI